MSRHSQFSHPSCALLLSALAIAACASGPSEPAASAESADTAWIADTSFEVGATITASVSQQPVGDWAEIATNEELQIALVDAQWKFAKNRLARDGYHLNQLSDTVRIVDTRQDGDLVTLTYEAKIDLIREIATGESPPAFEELEPKVVRVKLPVQPTRAFRDAAGGCVERHGDPDGERNFFYYFDADATDCDLPMVEADVKATEVYPHEVVYPEYDKLLATDLGGGKTGFRAALVPARGDHQALSRFAAHRAMLEQELQLVGEPIEDGKALRFTYTKAGVAIAIDLFDPTRTSLTPQFRAALGEYQLVFYNGHSIYGTRDLLSDASSFSDKYQIVMMHSCRSYPYYVRQVFRAKSTSEDPTGWAAADVVATGESSYPRDSPRTLRPLLEGLLAGMASAHEGTGAAAPSWNAIVKQMNDRTRGIMYGVAGVRTNSWMPR